MSSPSPRGDTSGRGSPPFVGRTQELDTLERCLREAAGGRPRVVLIQGEAGIGKTRLLHEAIAIARRLRMEVCFGRCYEDLALPYLPFVESLLPLLEQVPEEARASIGADLHLVNRLFQRAETPLADSRPSMSGQADHERLQLFLAVGHAAVRLAQSRPMLLIVEDLHWADRLSLDLFDHLAFTVTDAATREPVPIIVVGTYRPLAAGERFARLAARLQREEVCRSITLAGLDENET